MNWISKFIEYTWLAKCIYIYIRDLFRKKHQIDLPGHPCKSPEYMEAYHAPDDPQKWQDVYISQETDEEIHKIIIVHEFIVKNRSEQ